MDDIDVFKCREGRLDYLGLLSFMAIAVPMTVILLNEFIGDAILDAVIPGIYAGIMVMGATLYTISLLALLLPFCIVIGILWYLIFIYRPAQHAHDRRKEVLKRCLLEDSLSNAHSFRQNGSSARFRGSAFGRQTLTGYLSRVRTIAKHGIQDGISWISGGDIRLRDPRKHIVQRDWCHLNMLPCYQGSIYEATAEPDAKDRNLSIVVPSRHAMFLPPVKISNMMTSSTQWKALYQHRQKGLNNDVANLLDDSDQLVVMRPMVIESPLRALRSPIIFDPAEILTRLWIKVATSYPDAQRGSKEVSMDALYTEFEAILTVFYPDGIRLSEAEKAEACEMFNHWRQWRHLDEEYVRDPPSGEEVVSFRLFDDWFIDTLVNALRGRLPERLLDHTLHHMPIMKRRLLKASPSLRIDRSPSFKGPQSQTRPRASLKKDLKENEQRNSCSTLQYEMIYDPGESEAYGTPPTFPLSPMDSVFALHSKYQPAESTVRVEYEEIYDSVEAEGGSYTSPMPRPLSPVPSLACIPASTLNLLQARTPPTIHTQTNTETYNETELEIQQQTLSNTHTNIHTNTQQQQNTQPISNTHPLLHTQPLTQPISPSLSPTPAADKLFSLPQTSTLHVPVENLSRRMPKKGGTTNSNSNTSNRWASISSRSSQAVSDLPTISTSFTDDSSLGECNNFDDFTVSTDHENRK